MNNAAEQKAVLTIGDITRDLETFDERFPILRVSTLSLEDSFLKFEPFYTKEQRLKESIINSIRCGLKDFRMSAIDLSLDEEGNYIQKKGSLPALGKSALYSEEQLKAFMPEKNSRMTTLQENDVKLALLIKFLVEEEKMTVEEAWHVCCRDSSKIACCINSEDATGNMEPTGSRKVWKFCDWGNIWKTVKDDTSPSGYSIVGTYHAYTSKVCSLAYMLKVSFPEQDDYYSTPSVSMDV